MSLTPRRVAGRLHTAATCVALVVLTGMTGSLALGPGAAEAAQVSVAGASVADAPSAPLEVAAQQAAAGTVTVTWNAPASEGSTAVTGYDVGWSTGQSGGGMSVGATERSATLVEMPKGTFTFWVAAVNAAGSGPRISVELTVAQGAPAPTSAVSAGTITAWQHVTISGTGSAGTWVDLERALPGKPFVWMASTEVDDAGTFAFTRAPHNTAAFRVVGASGAHSVARTVVVRNRLDLTATRTARRTYTLAGTVFPAHQDQTVTLASKGADGTWTALARVHTNATGHWTYKHTYAARAWTFRARSAATTRNAAGSRVLSVTVN